MALWDNLLRKLGIRHTYPLNIRVPQDVMETLSELARVEQRPLEQVVSALITQALARRRAAGHYLLLWQTLSEREKQVAAQVCLYYTNRQIAAHLGIADDTVKTHVRNVLVKFNLRNRSDLRLALADWDFNDFA
jgi:DNA-binding CsgD family transcriptional regulator